MKTQKLGEVARIFNGNSINEKVKSKVFTGVMEGTPYIATKDISFSFQVDYENGVKIPNLNKNEFKKAKKRSVLLCAEGGSAGRKMAIIDRDVFFVNKLFCFECSDQLNSKYLFYYLQTENFQNLFKNSITGLIGGVSLEKVRNLPIVLPSLDNQNEIVEKLDSAFAELDSLEENVAKLILLNDSLLRSKINSELGVIRKSVDNKILGDFGKINYGYTARSSSNYVGPKYLRITDIQDKFVDWAKVPRCEIASEEKSKFKLSQGDIVFARTGATTGKSFLIDSDVDAVFASYLIRIKPDTTKLDPEFLYYFFQSSYYWDQIADGISGSAQGGFNASKLHAIKVSFPSDLVVQKEVVIRIREFEVQLNLRTRKLLQEANSVRGLRQSLLSSAFIQESEVA
jgi:type I restriction enzyme S subunit